MLSPLRPHTRGRKLLSRSGQKYSQLLAPSASNAVSVTERQVRFTEQFFDRLELLFPTERGVDGTPSVTDFLLLELPAVRDRLATDFAGSTLATDDADIRVFIGAGILVSRFAIFAALDDDVVEAFWIVIDTDR